MIAARGARLVFLPPHIPGFNPVEMAFAKLTALPREVSERTTGGLSNELVRLVGAFTT
jgi:transposase